jgi:hypothetical protein
MALIKKKDVKSYFAARRNRLRLPVQPASEPDTTGFSNVENRSTDTSLANAIEVPESKSPPETPVSRITDKRNSGIALVTPAKKSVPA